MFVGALLSVMQTTMPIPHARGGEARVVYAPSSLEF